MLNEIRRYVVVALLLGLSILVIFGINKNSDITKNEIDNLVIYGDNIITDYKPFMEGNIPYIAVDTVSKVIDEYIYYDKVATKVIITTYDTVTKLKIDEKKISKNLEISDIENEAKLVNNAPYIPLSLFTDIYDITITYNEETNTLSIDKKNEKDLKIKYNQVNVYEDLSTSSKVLQTLYKNSTVKVYDESLSHARWYKVRTETGIVGYISKNNVDINSKEDDVLNEQVSEQDEMYNSKIVMFWQYGSSIETLGEKIDGVTVVSPTWYELKNSNGDITSEFSKTYYEKAKANGYEIWPIVTNGIDNSDYSSSDTSKLMNSETARENFIKNMLKIAQDNKLDGINIDFEAMKTDDKELYTQFIRELCPIFRKYGIKVSVDMYFVAYMERGEIGKAADYVALMGYDQRGNWSSEAGSISEISWVESNVKSLIEDSKISANKIILGVPFYTRLWIDNASAGTLTTKVYSMDSCNEFLKTNSLTKSADEKSGQNYAEYTKGNVTYKLWIEDDYSMKNRVDIINKYKLAGISGWQRGLETNDIWDVIVSNIEK